MKSRQESSSSRGAPASMTSATSGRRGVVGSSIQSSALKCSSVLSVPLCAIASRRCSTRSRPARHSSAYQARGMSRRAPESAASSPATCGNGWSVCDQNGFTAMPRAIERPAGGDAVAGALRGFFECRHPSSCAPAARDRRDVRAARSRRGGQMRNVIRVNHSSRYRPLRRCGCRRLANPPPGLVWRSVCARKSAHEPGGDDRST